MRLFRSRNVSLRQAIDLVADRVAEHLEKKGELAGAAWDIAKNEVVHALCDGKLSATGDYASVTKSRWPLPPPQKQSVTITQGFWRGARIDWGNFWAEMDTPRGLDIFSGIWITNLSASRAAAVALDAIRGKRKPGPKPGQLRRYEKHDIALIPKIDQIMEQNHLSVTEAIRLLEPELKGRGTTASRIKRCVAVYKRIRQSQRKT